MIGKAVLISIRPKWCALISKGEKTIEVRKTAPKLPTPFKCYIYCTKDPGKFEEVRVQPCNRVLVAQGKVIGEYICDEVYKFSTRVYLGEEQKISDEEIVKKSRVSRQELRSYEGRRQGIFGWQISDLVIYDTPKKLSEFDGICSKKVLTDCECGACKRLLENGNGHCPMDSLKRAPQSWRYVEELA